MVVSCLSVNGTLPAPRGHGISMKAAFTRTLRRGSGLISMKSVFRARGNLAHKLHCSLIRLKDMGRSVVNCAIGVIPPFAFSRRKDNKQQGW